MATKINVGSELAKQFNYLVSLIETNSIKPPSDYHAQVKAVKLALKNDESGLVNTVLDYAIQCASSVNYKVECDNENLSKIYNKLLNDINSSLRRKKVQIGVKGLAKEYFTKMLKGSSHALLRVIFNKKKIDAVSMDLPNLLWFADGKDIYVDNTSAIKKIGSEKYRLKIGEGNTKKDFMELPNYKGEEIFVQTPFDEWGTLEPVPFLIRRGIWKNMKVLEMISDQGEGIVRKALKYLLVVLMGNDKTFDKFGHYEPTQLKESKNNFKQFLSDLELEGGTPTMFGNYDMKIDHLIPDFTKVIKKELQDPSSRKILQGLGLIEVLEGTGTASRREAVVNPKPFIKLVDFLIQSYCSLLTDVLEVTRERNSGNIKYNAVSIKVKASPVLDFISMDEKQFLRTIFDRGVSDFETFCESIGIDYDVVRTRSKKQLEDGAWTDLYPHYITNNEKDISPVEEERYYKTSHPKIKDKETPDYKDDRMNSGGKNFIQAAQIFESAVYGKNKQLPKSVKKLPIDLQRTWRTIWNKQFRKTGSEAEAFRLAWGVVNRLKRNRLKK